MKKKQVNTILSNQSKRKKIIFFYISIAFIFFVLAIFLIFMYFKKSKNYTVSYKEDGNIDYKVYLKKNDYYNNNYLNEDNEYIENLIDYIGVNFNYKINLKENINFKYNYKINAQVIIKNKNAKKNIYEFNNTLLDNKEILIKNKNDLKINEYLKIDYNYYNELAKRFINNYDLEDANSTLNINMYINTLGTYENIDKSKENESILKLNIPLNKKTLDIDINNTLTGSDYNIIVCEKKHLYSFIYLILSILCFFGIIFFSLKIIKVIKKTRSPKDIYDKELGKILNNYGSYIEEVENINNINEYNLWKIKSFDDMLEICDKINQPILMKEYKDDNKVYFFIPTNDKKIYLYIFSINKVNNENK